MRLHATKLRLVGILLTVCLLATAAFAGAWSEWSALPDGRDDNVDIAYRQVGTRTDDGTYEFHWKYQNNYRHRVKIEVDLHYIDKDDREQIEKGTMATIDAGEEYTSGGFWLYGKRIVGSRISKITMLD